ncbi:MAG: helix-turn-helix transcriptional regulator [Verrucomicrobiota bacterium]
MSKPNDAKKLSKEAFASIKSRLENFPILVECHDRRLKTEYHRQPGIEINVTHNGSGVLEVGEFSCVLTPRHVVLFRGQISHQLKANRRYIYERTVIAYDAGFKSSKYSLPKELFPDDSWIPEDRPLNLQLSLSEYQEFDRLALKLKREQITRRVGWEISCAALLLQISVLLQRNLKASKLKVENATQHLTYITDLVQLSCDFVRNDLSGDLSLTTVAKAFSVRPEHLTRCFTKELGVSFSRYVLLERLQEAKRLLIRKQEVSVIDVALATGFQSHSHFSRKFKSVYLVSPSEYRSSEGSI